MGALHHTQLVGRPEADKEVGLLVAEGELHVAGLPGHAHLARAESALAAEGRAGRGRGLAGGRQVGQSAAATGCFSPALGKNMRI